MMNNSSNEKSTLNDTSVITLSHQLLNEPGETNLTTKTPQTWHPENHNQDTTEENTKKKATMSDKNTTGTLPS